MLNTVNLFIALVVAAITYGTPLLFGTLGEVLTEKSGSLNLGVEGIMFMGGAIGLGGVFYYEKAVESPSAFLAVLIGLLCAFIAGGIASLIFSFLTITLRANQNVTGLAMTTFGVGFGNFFGGSLIKLAGADVPSISLSTTSSLFRTTLPFAGSFGVFGQMFLSFGFLVYVAIVIALVSSHVLTKTRIGLQLRAVGEDPATADAAGFDITRYKYVATCLGCMIAGLGGLYILYLFICTSTDLAIKKLYKMLPYVVTIVVLVITSVRNKRENQPPESLGLPYFREDR